MSGMQDVRDKMDMAVAFLRRALQLLICVSALINKL
ncbi:hypothetical protein MASSI9I_20472 [Massilia sp. 9I]|nr:hypothetical protein MASSI9I_20472 [Massilia sp. 9I]